jgi:hypothetical protein
LPELHFFSLTTPPMKACQEFGNFHNNGELQEHAVYTPWVASSTCMDYIHRVNRVRGFFSSRPNWDYPTPLTPWRVSSPLLWFGGVGGGGYTLAWGRGGCGPRFRRGTVVPIHRRRKNNMGRSSTCHTERKTIKREERLAVNMALLANMGVGG